MPEFDYQEILDTYRDLVNEANQANEDRYDDILGVIDNTQDQVGGTYDRVGELLQTLGDTQMQRVDEREQEALGQTTQSMIDRGLYNTTRLDTMRRGVQEDAQEARTDIQNQVAQQQAGVLEGLAQHESQLGRFEASIMEGRTDQGPNLGIMTQLLQQAAAGEARQEAEGGNRFLGLSPNARAGRDAFGDPMDFGEGGGGSGGGSGGDPSFTGAQGGSSAGSGASTYYPNSGGGVRSAIAGSTNRAVSSSGGGGAAGGGGSFFDNLFTGQPVYSRGDQIGTYAGGGQTNLADNLNLLGQGGEIDPNRIPEEQGGEADTPEEPATTAKPKKKEEEDDGGGAWFYNWGTG